MDNNDVLYFEDSSYEEELAEITAIVVDMLVTCLDQDYDKVIIFGLDHSLPCFFVWCGGLWLSIDA